MPQARHNPHRGGNTEVHRAGRMRGTDGPGTIRGPGDPAGHLVREFDV